MKRFIMQHARELTRATLFDLMVFALCVVGGYKAHGQAVYAPAPAAGPYAVQPIYPARMAIVIGTPPLPPGSFVLAQRHRPVHDFIWGAPPALLYVPQQPQPQQLPQPQQQIQQQGQNQ